MKKQAYLLGFLVLFLSFAVNAFAGNKNDLAYLGYDELGTVNSLAVSDELVVFESDVPKRGTSISSILALATTFSTLGLTGNLTIDDGVTDSPSLILKDATDETATFVKTDGSHLTMTIAAADALQVTTGNLRVGNGTNGVALNGEDAYIEGTLEVDGAVQFDGAVSATSTLGVTGALTASSHATIDGRIDIGTVETFTDEDATPDVSTGSYFKTNTTATTITDFDGTGISDGQVIVVVSKGAITYDVTSSGIKGGSTDIITAAGDVTTFMYDGTDWLVIARMDMSDDLN